MQLQPHIHALLKKTWRVDAGKFSHLRRSSGPIFVDDGFFRSIYVDGGIFRHPHVVLLRHAWELGEFRKYSIVIWVQLHILRKSQNTISSNPNHKCILVFTEFHNFTSPFYETDKNLNFEKKISK
jgi:hypothetical protein